MPLEVVYGESRDRSTASKLAEKLREVVSDGTVYLGYPVLATADDRVEVDALLVSKGYGLVAFLLEDTIPRDADGWDLVSSAQDRLYNVLESTLGKHSGLRRRRQLALEISTVTVFPGPVGDQPPTSRASTATCSTSPRKWRISTVSMRTPSGPCKQHCSE
ncbi:hypothetical protein DDE05_37030 [Streptomyces cavourensis]|nr:hypothetical protein DDE05_37030 [Streptomyces cavourensis]